jgi:hypothetical protein
MSSQKRIAQVRGETEHMLAIYLEEIVERDQLWREDLDAVVGRLPDKESDLEELLVAIRYALAFEGKLTDVFGDDLTEQVVRQFLMALEVEISARVTGEPKRRLPFEVEFHEPPDPWFDPWAWYGGDPLRKQR